MVPAADLGTSVAPIPGEVRSSARLAVVPLDHHARTRSDADFFGLRSAGADGRFRFRVASHLSRFDQGLYGGAAVGVALTAVERRTGRDAIWLTTQFVAMPPPGAEVDVHVEVLAEGRRTSQVRVTGTSGDRTAFVSLGAAGIPKPEGMQGTFERPPQVTAPESGDVGFPTVVEHLDIGWLTAAEIRIPEVVHHPDQGPGRLCVWSRRLDGERLTPAVAAYLADIVPLSVARACGVTGAGTSVDNTVRIGQPVETEWLLVDMRPHLAAGNYGHATAHLWSENGDLLATTSQTAAMVELPFDPLTH